MHIKLATRLAKAKLHGVRSRALSLHPESNKSQTANQLAAKALEEEVECFATSDLPCDGEKTQEMRMAWKVWQGLRDECSQHNKKECKLLTSEAESRLRGLPILKSSS